MRLNQNFWRGEWGLRKRSHLLGRYGYFLDLHKCFSGVEKRSLICDIEVSSPYTLLIKMLPLVRACH